MRVPRVSTANNSHEVPKMALEVSFALINLRKQHMFSIFQYFNLLTLINI